MATAQEARQHATRARYNFGPTGDDRQNGCRCDECRAANTAYQQRRTGYQALVPASAVRTHLAAVALRWGLSHRQLAELTGLERSAVGDILSGATATVRGPTAASILQLSLEHYPGRPTTGLVAGEPTWRRIDELRAAGWSQARIALALGMGRQLQIRKHRILAVNANKVAALHAAVVVAKLRVAFDQWPGLVAAAWCRSRPTPRSVSTPVQEALDLLGLPPEPWRTLGACRLPGVDPAIFFPGRGESTLPAKTVCRSCPVRAECLVAGLDQKFGIWGGYSERERRRMRRVGALEAVAP